MLLKYFWKNYTFGKSMAKNCKTYDKEYCKNICKILSYFFPKSRVFVLLFQKVDFCPTFSQKVVG